MSKLVLLIGLLISSVQLTFAQTAKPAPQPTPGHIHAKVGERLIDASIANDPAVNQMLEAYRPKVRSLNEVIGKLKGDLRKGGIGAGSMGDFVTDGLRAEASQRLGKPVVLAFTNAGGLRKSVIPSGDIKLRDVYELLPFENALVAFDLTGTQVLEILRVVIAGREAQSGARIKYRLSTDKRPKMDTARLLIDGAETQIDPAAIYTVVTTDYLLNVTAGDYSATLKQAKNIRPMGVTLRDAMIDYVKTVTAAGRQIRAAFDGRYALESENGATTQEAPR